MTSSTVHPAVICLTETHLYIILHDATDTICPVAYVIAACRNGSLHGVGAIIIVQEKILFDEIDALTVSLPEVSKTVAISHHESLIVCCYCQPSTSDLTLFRLLGKLLNVFFSHDMW